MLVTDFANVVNFLGQQVCLLIESDEIRYLFCYTQYQKLNCRSFWLDWFFKWDCGLQQYALSYFQLYFDFNLYLFITMNRQGKTKKWGRRSKMCLFFSFFFRFFLFSHLRMMLQIYLHYTFIVIYTCLIEWKRDRHSPLSGLFIHSCLTKAKNLQTSHVWII